MRIGTLRKQIAIQQEQQTSDGAGGYTLGWSTLATVWAEIAPLAGSEPFVSGHLEGHMSHKVTLRWRSDVTITTDMRLLYNARAFDIHAVLNSDERNHWLELLVEEGGPV